MHKPVISLTVPAATIATIVLLPSTHINLGIVTLSAIVVASIMATWASVYMLLQKRRGVHV